MKNSFIKIFFIYTLILFAATLFAQQDQPAKFALVIGNGNYAGLARLVNPVNDANDIAAVLERLGFTVDKILNGNRVQMENAVMRLKEKLGAAENGYGFFFYAGHGVQSGGENYLIPVDANIPGENYLRDRAVSIQAVLDDLNDAKNSLNVVVLDACRDNPFGWSRSGTRGLAIVTRQPSDSIIVYATSAGQRASDGDGRNGLFTSQLIMHLTDQSLEVGEVFKRTGADVAKVSNNQQVPAIYSQFFGTAYLGSAPVEASGYVPGTAARPSPLPEKRKREPIDSKKFWTVGAALGTSFVEPWLVGTVSGTIAPFRYSFLGVGLDIGFISGKSDVGFLSFAPFVYYAYFWPFPKMGAGYAGAGVSFTIANYSFPEGDIRGNTAALDLVAGVCLFDMLNVNYTFRTSFKHVSNKLSVGYNYRFK